VTRFLRTRLIKVRTINSSEALLAVRLADIEVIVLSTEHWEILHFIRQFYIEYKYLPNARVFSKAIKNKLQY
jgi:TusE/DsrC/DsvC family sulfur relay protein